MKTKLLQTILYGYYAVVYAIMQFLFTYTNNKYTVRVIVTNG